MPMNMDEYQSRARAYEAYECAPEHHGVNLYPFLALAEEAGEACGKVAKALRQGAPIDRTAVVLELGDVLWQVSACASELGFRLDEVAKLNLSKLEGRAQRSTIVGEGDDR